jgi:formylglycine-generating enzyme required for sulfatase activity
MMAGLVLIQPLSINSGTQNAQTTPHRDPRTSPNFTISCIRCHKPDGARPVSDYNSRPECAECHLPDGQGDLPEKNRPQPIASLVSNPADGNKISKPGASLPDIKPESMIFIPPGEFRMGNNGRPLPEGEGDDDESPAHPVYVPGFRMDKYEVTNAQYSKFIESVHSHPPSYWKNGNYPPGKADHPVAYVDWFDANDYCHWAGKRLPSEEEWEKAARGTDGRHFPWGDTFDFKKANTPQYWLLKHEKGDTMPVGSFENGKSPYGLYDMAGNVYEWTASWYKPYPGNRAPNIHYGQKNRILRGGSWYDCLSYGCGLSSPSYNRSRFNPDIKNKGFGFRCAKFSDEHKE